MVRVIHLQLFVALLLVGCGARAVDIAQTALSTTARGFVQVDNSTAPAHDRARQAAVEECEGWACYDEHTAGWNTFEESLRAARSFLTAAQAGVDSWREGESDERSFGDLAACVLDGASDVVAALDVLGLDVPELVTSAIALLGGFTGECAATAPEGENDGAE